jgi:hypothetical protein
MKRLALRSLGLAAVTAGALLAMGAPAQADWSGFNSGFLSGNQVSNTVQVPVSVCGNAISVLGFASASCAGGAYAYNGGGGYDDYDNGYDNGFGGYSNGYHGGGANAAGTGNHHRRHHRHHNH